MSFEIVVEPGSLEVAASGNVVGIIYMLIGDVPFPDSMWWDLPCLVLAQWFRAFQVAGQRRVDMRFMDGPAVIEADRFEGPHGGLVTLYPRLDTSSPTMFEAVTVAEHVITAELRRAARAVVQACEEQGLPDQGLSSIAF